jgi:hypothetical protein
MQLHQNESIHWITQLYCSIKLKQSMDGTVLELAQTEIVQWIQHLYRFIKLK